jgi:hypothetical protein
MELPSLVKKVIGKMFQGGGREKNTHTFRQVDMFKWHKVIPRHIKVLVIGLHMVGNAYGS